MSFPVSFWLEYPKCQLCHTSLLLPADADTAATVFLTPPASASAPQKFTTSSTLPASPTLPTQSVLVSGARKTLTKPSCSS